MCGWLSSGCPDVWIVVVRMSSCVVGCCQDVLMCGWLSSGCPDVWMVVVRMS